MENHLTPYQSVITEIKSIISSGQEVYCRMLDAYALQRAGGRERNPVVCFPVTAIAAVLSRSPMTVKRSLNELETAGLIMRVRQGVGETE